MTDWNMKVLPAPGMERPDITPFTFPAATVTDTSTEEIEIDQALSLASRQGRDFLGAIVAGQPELMGIEHLTIGTADHTMELLLTLATRTGAFSLADPELIWRWFAAQYETAPTTAQAEVMNPVVDAMPLPEPFLYVAPRLFWRTNNNVDASLVADAQSCRLFSMGRKLSFRLFIELLERFADVTLL
ncbi:MAG: hypothetical protein LN413_07005 [Candidatus Thermoplasmatota archaeon]|nr:hypothetical protein [Candidatus Thermoplasmatota archaeon]